MAQNRRNVQSTESVPQKRPPDIFLQMEVWEEELSAAQRVYYKRAENEYAEITARLSDIIKAQGGEIIDVGQDVTIVQTNGVNPSIAVLNNMLASNPQTYKNRNQSRVQSQLKHPPPQPQQQQLSVQPPQPQILPPQPAPPQQTQPTLQGVQPISAQSLFIQGGTVQGPPRVTRPGTGPPQTFQPSQTFQAAPGTYQLMMDPVLGLIVGTVPNQQTAVSSAQIIQTSTVKQSITQPQPTTSVQPSAKPRGRPPASSRPPVPVPSNAATSKVLLPPVSAGAVSNVKGNSTTGGVTTYRIKPKANSAMTSLPVTSPSPAPGPVLTKVPPPILTPAPAPTPATATAPTPTPSSIPASLSSTTSTSASPPIFAPVAGTRPTENNSIGGLSAGKHNRVNTTVSGDGKSTNAPDSHEVTFNKLSGKTFPSLVVVARPHLHAKDMLQAKVKQEREALDAKVKSVLMYSPTKFTEWLIQQGLVRSEHYCSIHSTSDGPSKLKLGMYSDVNKFPYSGGYVWISECCPHRFVSVFSGSIFEGAPHSPTMLLKLMYHWCCQTNVQNVVQWVKVDNFYVKSFFTNMRSVCIAAVHEKYEKLGGPQKRVEVGVISLGTTSQDGNMRQVKVEVLGVMDPESKLIRLRAVEPLQDGERNYKRRFVKILEPLEQWVDKDSIILTDFTVDKSTLQSMGFNLVHQSTLSDKPSPSKYCNQNIMEYLRRIVPRMFQNTLSLLSRQIIQQFLDELVWRERWGPVPSQAFDSILSHLAAQTKLDTGENLLMRLTKIASNPFRKWNYDNWKNNGGITPLQPPPSPSSLIQHMSSVLAKTSVAAASPPLKPKMISDRKTKDHDVVEIEEVVLVETGKEQVKTQPPVDRKVEREEVKDTGNLVSLEGYYYGTKEVMDEDLAKEYKTDSLNAKCPLCHEFVQNNLDLMKHLTGHSEDAPKSSEIPNLIQCRYCIRSFATEGHRRVHVEEVHKPSTSKLHCLICCEKFPDRGKLILHMHQTHTQLELPYQCSICLYRGSEQYKLVDHFYEVHANGEKVQCPFCLKCVAISNAGKKMAANTFFYMHHVKKHQTQTNARKCERCALWFVHKGILKDHLNKDHLSCKDDPGVIPHRSVSSDCLMMPLPSSSNSVKTCVVKSSVAGDDNKSLAFQTVEFNSLKIVGLANSGRCAECHAVVTEVNHFPGYLSCMSCLFSTCCSQAMADHTKKFHCKKSLLKTRERPILLSEEMHCVCGFRSRNGNQLAKHLALCKRKSAYPSVGSALAAIAPSTSVSSSLDVALDEGQNRDSNPPSMLKVLGLVRKPSLEDNPEKFTSPVSLEDDSSLESLSTRLSFTDGSKKRRSKRSAQEAGFQADTSQNSKEICLDGDEGPSSQNKVSTSSEIASGVRPDNQLKEDVKPHLDEISYTGSSAERQNHEDQLSQDQETNLIEAAQIKSEKDENDDQMCGSIVPNSSGMTKSDSEEVHRAYAEEMPLSNAVPRNASNISRESNVRDCESTAAMSNAADCELANTSTTENVCPNESHNPGPELLIVRNSPDNNISDESDSSSRSNLEESLFRSVADSLAESLMSSSHTPPAEGGPLSEDMCMEEITIETQDVEMQA